MEVLDGNSSDSESFRQTLERFGESLYHHRELRTIIADSKLYSQQTLQVLEESGLNWISRVPGTLEAVKQLLDQIQPTDLADWDWEGEGYQSACYTNEYGEVKQHWVVYHSAKAAKREEKTLRRKVEKEAEKAGKSLRKLQRQVFHCQADAQAAAAQWEQQWKWHRLVKVALKEQRQYAQPGRPAKDSPAQISYQIEAQLKFQEVQWQAALFRRSLFVLATNQELNLAEEQQALLEAYKAQHSVERGFRFIKDPQIVASAFFVKKPERVAALLFVMTTCLLVYSALEYLIRKRLKETETTVPDQKGKPTQSPTARWVFQLFVGIHQLILPDQNKIILNLKEEHHTITQLLGYAHFYS